MQPENKSTSFWTHSVRPIVSEDIPCMEGSILKRSGNPKLELLSDYIKVEKWKIMMVLRFREEGRLWIYH